MNILYTIISFNVGGAEKLLVDILNNWKNKQDNVTLCIINDEYKIEMIEKIKKRNNISIEYIKRSNGSKDIRFFYKYLKLIRRNNINIIHCQDKESLIFSSFAKILNPRIKIFNTIHDTKIYNNLNNIYIFLDKIFTKKIIAISDSVKKDIIFRGISENKIEIVYNGIDFSPYNKYKKENNKYYTIGCVARIKPQKKGQDILINAIEIVKKEYPNIKCYFAGTYEQKDKEDMIKLKNMIVNKKLEDNIMFLGNVKNIPKFLKKIDLFVLPSRQEGFGLVIIEAMAAKIPVISSNIEGPREIIKNNEYGLLFKKENYNDLAEKILYSIKYPNKNLEYIYNYSKNFFEINYMIKKLRGLYLE